MIDCFTVHFPAVSGPTERQAYVYLPSTYDEDEDRRYPVLYMFDGHNVFFDEDATYGRSWRLGEYLDYTDTQIIVAAVECNTGVNNERISEYSPFDLNEDGFGSFKGLGKQTMRWFINRFKPMIDSGYRTLPGRRTTFIAGSSMGGLMSLYAVLRYNRVFSRAAALSPSIILPEKEDLDDLILHSRVSRNTVIYMDAGSNELPDDQDQLMRFPEVCGMLIRRGIYVTSRIVPRGNHNEASWELQEPFFIPALLYGLNL